MTPASLIRTESENEEMRRNRRQQPRVLPRLVRMSPASTRVRSLRAPSIGRLVSVTGTVVRASGVRPLPTSVPFECTSCGAVAEVALEGGRWAGAPRACNGSGSGNGGGGSCRSRRFFPDLAATDTVDWQRLRLQDLPVDGDSSASGNKNNGGNGEEEEEEEDAPGAAPAAIDVDVAGDLVACAAPGDVVTVVGLVKVCAASAKGGGGGAAGAGGGGGGGSATSRAGLYVAYLDAISIERANNSSSSSSSAAATNADGTGIGVSGLLLGGPQEEEEEEEYDEEGNPSSSSSSQQQQGDAPAGAARFSHRDLAFVVKFVSEVGRSPLNPRGGGAFRHLVHALAPGIYGHEMVKAALVLALFGGVGCEKEAREEKRKKRKNKARKKKKRNDDDESSSSDDDDDERDPSDFFSSFSSSNNNSNSSITPRRRSEIHVLLCGDPGLGKSQLLKAAAAAAPRGVFVCAASGTAAGLTASVSRDPLTGQATLEAGALALADKGCCCVDEFDKLAADPGALLGALEQQEVAVAKAGVLARLPARASLLAAANPAGGSHDPTKSLAENVALPRALLSRFDLVFLMEDKPTPAADAALAAHVLALAGGAGPAGARAAAKAALASCGVGVGGGGGGGSLLALGGGGGSGSGRGGGTQGEEGNDPLFSLPPPPPQPLLSLPPPASQATPGGGWIGEREQQQQQQQRSNNRWRQKNNNGALVPRSSPPSKRQQQQQQQRRPLAERLLHPFPADADPIPRSLFRTYVAYARAHCHPTLSRAARRALREAYLRMREEAAAQGARHVTPRALEALARLAEARARADLREIVTAEDAEDAAELAGAALGVGGGGGGVATCGWGAAADEAASLGSRNGRGRAAARAEAERFLAAASKAAVAKRSDVFTAGELCALADAIELDVTDVPSLLEALNDRGELLKKGGGAYSVARARAALARAEERQGAYNNNNNENSRPFF